MADLTERVALAWAAHLRTKRNHRQARRSSFDAGWTAALAAVADAPGLTEALRAHQMTWHAPSYRATCPGCPHMVAARTLERFRDVAARHLADVVRAWLRGEG